MQTLFIVRHATPDWTRTDIPYHIPPGPPLTAQGISEAESLGTFFKNHTVTRCYASPLERCWNTAQIACQAAGIIPVMRLELIEWQPEDSPEAVRDRLSRLLEEILVDLDQHNPTALVTHGAPIAMLLRILGLPENEIQRNRVYDHRNPTPPAGVWMAQRQNPKASWEIELTYTPQLI